MFHNPLRRLQAYLLIGVRKGLSQKEFGARVLICLAIGITLLSFTSGMNYDMRLQARGPQKSSPDIVLILIDEKKWASMLGENQNVIRHLKEITRLTDSFFWHEGGWARMLTKLLKLNPALIGVCFYFGDPLQRPLQSELNYELFTNESIIWAADIDSTGRVLMPKFARSYGENVGVGDIRTEADGRVRRFASHVFEMPHFALRLAQNFRPDDYLYSPEEPTLINFQGPAGHFRRFSFEDLLQGRITSEDVAGKIVLIGAQDSLGHRFLTPVGKMARAEVFANITNNILQNQWIRHAPTWTYIIYLCVLMVVCLWILHYYPQSVSLVFFTMIALLCTAVSAWVFDSYYLWIPTQAPLGQMAATYIIFLSYQLSIKEKQAWQLEQEKHTIFKIEQLKDNFVSLISHDLKTPIARIQAVVDRLLSQTPNNTLRADLQSIRSSSHDLHRYIQSILQVIRVESREFKLHKEAADINDIIEQVVAQLQATASEKNIGVSTHLEPLFSIELDITLIFEVILNLLENAIKYTPAGGAVEITSQEIDDWVFVHVQDNGPGIAPEEQDKVWERFFRGHKHSLSTKGSGLGLYLVKYFIELHGGRVFLKSDQSADGHGTRIGFSLPLGAEEV